MQSGVDSFPPFIRSIDNLRESELPSLKDNRTSGSLLLRKVMAALYLLIKILKSGGFFEK